MAPIEEENKEGCSGQTLARPAVYRVYCVCSEADQIDVESLVTCQAVWLAAGQTLVVGSYC